MSGNYRAGPSLRAVSSNDNLASGGGGPQTPGMEARVAVLEQIAKDTRETLVGIRTDLAEFRREMSTRFDGVNARFDALNPRFEKLRDDQRSDFKWLFGTILGLGALGLTLGGTLLTVMAKGFKWF